MKTKVLFSALCLLVSIGVCAGNRASAQANGDSDEQAYELPKLNSEDMPQYPGGISAMMAFIGENIKYPKDAEDAQFEGRVLCTFIINKRGKVTDVKVVESGGMQSLDDEAVRVVSMMPNWKPGRDKGKPVNVIFTIPIQFRLK